MLYRQRRFLIRKNTEKLRVLLLAPTGKSTLDTGRTTIHSALEIKPLPKLNGSSDRSNVFLRNKLSEM